MPIQLFCPVTIKVLRMKQDRYSYTRQTDNKKEKSDKPCDVPSSPCCTCRSTHLS